MTTHGPTIHAPATNLVKAKNDVEQIDKEKFSSTNKVSQYEFKQFRFGLERGGKGEGFFLLKYIYAMQLKLLTCALIPHVSNQFYPIWFAQSSPFVTHISRPKGSHYSFSWKSLFCGGLCFRFFFRDRPIKMIHCLKKQKSLGFKPYLSP